MLLKNDLQNFFRLHGIKLEEQRFVGAEKVSSIFESAYNVADSFGRFVLVSLFNPSRDGIMTNFSSFEELYDCYLVFCTGLMGNKC